jgi:hypothetical protein
LATGLLVVLAAIGVVNGLWSKNLVINGTVETGDLQVDFTDLSRSADPGLDPCTSFGSPDGPDEGTAPDCPDVPKNVAVTQCFVHPNDDQILVVRIFNGYPSYEGDCEYHFANTGSIPFNVIGAVVDEGQNLTGCGPDTNTGPAVVVFCDQLKIGYFDNIGEQVDPGEDESGSLIVHVQQPALQSDCTAETELRDSQTPGGPDEITVVGLECTRVQSYEFFIKICVAQWNEAADYESCAGSLQHEGPGGPGGVGDPDYDNEIDPNDNCPTDHNPNQNPEACDGADNDGDGEVDEPDEDEIII